ncbi:probable 28S rRNA (cytosine-C(5))-methyltransferase [Spodoptera litura]|uniref:Probable 28S rRNA (Cytosine-C(5))-methyltransferase n=1 Tax=Spodoptera litura TaxID=69820 RepID=A0A9J7DXV0_SPOLT|nr:probable 28S rRNA (cytosine-C(5))-methyltransferase [Spodoptera litura]
MFEHSVKVPRHYKIAANIFKKVATEGGSVKTLLYDDKLRHFRTNVLYALITETIKHASHINKIFENCKILENESRLDPWLAKILTAELLFGKKALPGKSKPEQTVLSYKDQFEKFSSEHKDDFKTEVAPRPRYVRINTNLLTTSDAIRAFQDEGYRFIRCTSGSYADYLEQIQNLTEEDFTQDYHVKTMFVFAAGTKLHEHELYLENKIILQDKATAMAVHLLAPPPGSVVLDMCAAPGMKTTQLAAFLRNNGRIYAVERDEKRHRVLCDFVHKTGSTCVEPLHKDALEIKKGDLDKVEYILLDPSCSGSGMDFCVHSYIESSRLARLTSLQEKFLKHAMNAFPNCKRIVYSTCSLYPEENERVITNVVKTSRAKWRVQDVKELLKGQWNNFGSGMYGSIGTRCLYSKPDSDFTTGFFLAVLDRDPKDMEKSLNAEKQSQKQWQAVNKGKSQKKESINDNNNDNGFGEEKNESSQDLNDEKVERKSKKKKNKSKLIVDEDTETDQNNTQEAEITDEPPKQKKKKRKHDDNSVNHVIEQLDDLSVECEIEVPKKKKKKKDKHAEEINDTSIPIDTSETNGETEHKQKKKRKKDLEHEVDGEIKIKVKKNKSKKSDSQETEMEYADVELEVPKKKKKKKSKD